MRKVLISLLCIGDIVYERMGMNWYVERIITEINSDSIEVSPRYGHKIYTDIKFTILKSNLTKVKNKSELYYKEHGLICDIDDCEDIDVDINDLEKWEKIIK